MTDNGCMRDNVKWQTMGTTGSWEWQTMGNDRQWEWQTMVEWETIGKRDNGEWHTWEWHSMGNDIIIGNTTEDNGLW